MDYTKIYDSLISFRRKVVPLGYSERHHILPVSLGGSEDSENIVRLTAREHFISHLLLHRIHRNRSTCAAVIAMSACSNEHGGNRKFQNSWGYEWARREFSKIQSESLKGESNPQYGTKWISNLESEISTRISIESPIPDGWVIGRNSWNPIKKDKIRLENRRIKEERFLNDYDSLWEEFLECGLNIAQFHHKYHPTRCLRSLYYQFQKRQTPAVA